LTVGGLTAFLNSRAPGSSRQHLLERVQPSPIVSLNRAVAVAMVDGPRSALELITDIFVMCTTDSFLLTLNRMRVYLA